MKYLIIAFAFLLYLPIQGDILNAVKNGDIESVKKFIADKADVNTRDEAKNTLLIIAITNQNEELVKILIEAGADVQAKNGLGYNALRIALIYEKKEIIEILRKASWSPLYYAAYSGDLQKVKSLVSNTNINSKTTDGYTPLMSAALNGHKEIVHFLIESGADISIGSYGVHGSMLNPIRLAISGEHLDIINMILVKDPDILNEETLFMAIRTNNEKIIRSLVDRFDITKLKNIFEFAVEVNSPLAVKILLDKNVKVDLDSYFFSAAIEGHYEIVKLLVEAGANVNARIDGSTALIEVANEDHEKVAQYLIAAGADVNAQDINGWTALMSGAEEDSHEIVQMLIDAKADVNITNKSGETALMWACRYTVESAKALIAAGADVNIKSHSGKTALDIAREHKSTEAIKILEEAGAK